MKDLKDDSKLKQWFSDRIKKIGTEDKIRLSVDGNILFEKKIDTATKEDFEIKTGLYKIESIVEKEKKIPFDTKYVADESLNKGERSVIKKGIDGVIKTTYIKDEDGNLTLDKETKESAVDEVVKVGIKSTENTKEILSNTVYVADKEKARGLSNERIEGSNGYEKEVIKYTLNEKDGTISEAVEKTAKKATDTIIKVPAKDKVEVAETPSPVRYEKDSTREKGQNNITISGKKGTRKVTTTYEVNPKTGEVTEKVGTPEVKKATETVIKVAAKDKVEETKKENGKTVKVTTVYTVDEKTGNLTETVSEEEISQDVFTSKSDDEVPTVDEPKLFEGGVNSEVATATEKLPELKVAIVKDEEGNILDVLEISEKPKELKGYKYTGKEEVDREGNKVYIYGEQKSEKIPDIEKKTQTLQRSQMLNNDENNNADTTAKKGSNEKLRKLPNTGEKSQEQGLLAGILLATTLLLSRRKKDM